jgi:hypothetical protein
MSQVLSLINTILLIPLLRRGGRRSLTGWSLGTRTFFQKRVGQPSIAAFLLTQRTTPPFGHPSAGGEFPLRRHRTRPVRSGTKFGGEQAL